MRTEAEKSHNRSATHIDGGKQGGMIGTADPFRLHLTGRHIAIDHHMNANPCPDP